MLNHAAGTEDPGYFHYEKQDAEMEQEPQFNYQVSIDRNLLMQDEEGKVLLEEFGSMNKEYRGFIEHQRKQHE